MEKRRVGRPPKKLSRSGSLLTRRIRRLFDMAHDGNLLEAADSTGVPYTTIRDLYQGRSANPSALTLDTIANAYGIPATWFLRSQEGDELPASGWVVSVPAPKGWATKPEMFPNQWRDARRVVIPFAAWKFHRLMNALSGYLMSLPATNDRPIVGDAETEQELDLRLAGFLLRPLLDAREIGEKHAIYSDVDYVNERSGTREELERLATSLKHLVPVWEQALSGLVSEAGNSGFYDAKR